MTPSDQTHLARKTRPVAVRPVPPVPAKRLLIVTIDAPFLVTHHLPLAVAAREAGYDVHVAAPLDIHAKRDDRAAFQRIEEAGVPFHVIPLRRGNMNPLGELKLLRSLFALVGSLRPQLVHCIGLKPVLYGGLIARARGIPAVHAVTGLGTSFISEGLKAGLVRTGVLVGLSLAFGHAKGYVIVENPDDRALFVNRHVADPRRTFLLRGVGADLSLFHPRPPEAKGGEPPVVMFAGRLIAQKGVREFVDAARRLRAGGVPARFVVVGDRDPQNPSCIGEAELARWQGEGTIEWWGHSNDMPNTLRKADVFCLPSYREGLPKGLVEAAATGLALVATNVPGCREVVHQGSNGILVPPRDSQALEAAIFRLLTDSSFRHQAGIKSREIAVAEFSLDAFLTASLMVYRAALGDEGSGNKQASG